MCGEMAGDPISIPLLLGLGLDAFSMSATSIPKARMVINNLNFHECQDLVTQALTMQTVKDVNDLVTKFLVARRLI
jgi:phosphotransferase system enzyme I (PtsI)